MKIKALFLLAAMAIVSGCASTQQYVRFPDQSKTVEDVNKARVYVVRPSVVGGAISMKVSDGDTLIGKTGPKGYLCWERNPGSMELKGKCENTSCLTVQVEQGKVYHVKQSPRMGFFIARNKLEQVSAKEGRELVGKCKPPKLVE